MRAREEACCVREGEHLRGTPRAHGRKPTPGPRGGVASRQADGGFKGMIALGDRHSGRTLGITFWESEEAMRTSEEAAKRLREESAKAGGDTISSVERYEVGFFEVES